MLSNNIGNEGVTAFATNTTLTELVLEKDRVTPEKQQTIYNRIDGSHDTTSLPDVEVKALREESTAAAAAYIIHNL